MTAATHYRGFLLVEDIDGGRGVLELATGEVEWMEPVYPEGDDSRPWGYTMDGVTLKDNGGGYDPATTMRKWVDSEVLAPA